MDMMSTLDFLWYAGIAICAVYTVMFLKDIIQLSLRKKNCEKVSGMARRCTMIKKWAYTINEVKYDYTVNGKKYECFSSVKGVLKIGVNQGMPVDVYYDRNNPGMSFLDVQMKAALKSILVLVILAAGLILSMVFGM